MILLIPIFDQPIFQLMFLQLLVFGYYFFNYSYVSVYLLFFIYRWS